MLRRLQQRAVPDAAAPVALQARRGADSLQAPQQKRHAGILMYCLMQYIVQDPP